MKSWVAAILMVGTALRAPAQIVGHSPQSSPFRDLEYTQEWTLLWGYDNIPRDRLDISPHSGALTGIRWDWRVGGPAYVIGRLAEGSFTRRIIDTKQPIGHRYVGTESLPLVFSDLGLGINLTGFKTWHSLAPTVNAGGGLVADVRGRSDVSKFRFGAPVAFTFGAGVKWVPAGKWQVRLDWSYYLFKLYYPSSYFIRVGTDNPVLLPADPTSFWLRNGTLQVGLSYLYHH